MSFSDKAIYIPEVVGQLRATYGATLFNYNLSVYQKLSRQAEILWQQFQLNSELVCVEINNYHPDYLGKSPSFLFNSNLTYQDIQKTIACEYGFANWSQVAELKTTPLNQSFEAAIDLLLSGKLDELKEKIIRNPALIHQRSQFGHQATLFHYLASNGVEFYRQIVPLNLPELASYLIQNGADQSATMKVYGGQFDTLALLKSSAHPRDAGLLDQILTVFNT